MGLLLDGLGQQFFGLGRVHDLAPIPGEDTLAVFLKIPGFPGDGRVGSRLSGCAGPHLAGDQGGVHGHAPVVVHNAASSCRVLIAARLFTARSWIRRFRPVVPRRSGQACRYGPLVVWAAQSWSTSTGMSLWPTGSTARSAVSRVTTPRRMGSAGSGECYRGGEGPASQADHGVSDVDVLAASVGEARSCGAFHGYAQFSEHGSGEGCEGGASVNGDLHVVEPVPLGVAGSDRDDQFAHLIAPGAFSLRTPPVAGSWWSGDMTGEPAARRRNRDGGAMGSSRVGFPSAQVSPLFLNRFLFAVDLPAPVQRLFGLVSLSP